MKSGGLPASAPDEQDRAGPQSSETTRGGRERGTYSGASEIEPSTRAHSRSRSSRTDVLVGAVDLGHARQSRLTVGRPRALRILASDPPPPVSSRGSRPEFGQRRLAQAHHRRAACQREGAVLVHQIDLHVHSRLGGAHLHRVDHGRRHAGQLLVVVAAALPAVSRRDRGRCWCPLLRWMIADVRAGLFVDPAQLHRGDGLGRRLDGASAPLGLHAGVGRSAAERSLESLVAGRLDRDAPHRARRVEHGGERAREDLFSPDAWPLPGRSPRDTVKNSSYVGSRPPATSKLRGVDERRYRRLVVSPEDGAARDCGTHPSSSRQGLDAVGGLHGIHVRSQRHMRSASSPVPRTRDCRYPRRSWPPCRPRARRPPRPRR